MNLLKEVNAEVEGVPVEPETPDAGPAMPDGWSVGHLAHHGMILSCDGFQLKLDIDQLNKFFDIAEDGAPGEIKDQNSKIILVEPTDDSIVLTRTGDEVYPNGVSLDLDTLKEMGIEQDDSEQDDEEDDTIATEAVKMAFRKSGGKIKRGFRVTSGIRKGRVVANMATAFKPRAKASTRMKLKLASKKKETGSYSQIETHTEEISEQTPASNEQPMRLKELLENSIAIPSGSPDELRNAIKQIKKDCKPFLNQMGNKLLFRGSKSEMRSAARKYFAKRSVRSDRKPMNTHQHIHDVMDKWFKEKFKINARSSAAFTTGDHREAKNYGVVYAIFPIGDFKFIWSPKILDLYISSPESVDELEEFLNNAEYTDKNLSAAIASGHEIMLVCDEYYMLIAHKPEQVENILMALQDENN